jgi:hypothetical protein
LRLALDFYVEEVPDYGLEHFVESWASAGIERLRPTLAYHPVRIFSPANPRRRLLDLEGDRCFLDAGASECFDGPVVPIFSERSAGVLEQLVEACRAREVAVDGWTVVLNNRALAVRHPDVAIQTALGSPDCTWLSPSHPASRAYVVGLIRAAGRSGYFEELQIEALYHLIYSYHPQDVVLGIDLAPLDRWLIGVCVSEHSKRLVDECGGDGERAAAAIAAHLDRRIAGAGPELPLTPEALAQVVGSDAGPLLRSRELAVERLLEAAVEEAGKHGLRLEFEDDVASWESFFTGEMTGPLSGDRHWEFGTDRKTVARLSDEYLLLLYFADDKRMRAEIDSCAAAIGRAPRVCLRPFPPDCRSDDELAERLTMLEGLGVDQTTLYMQSLMPPETPELVGRAVQRLRGTPA